MNPFPANSLFDEPASSPAKRRGLRLWRVEVLNWGTLGEDTVHAADLSGGWLCITGRNGTGKSTLADAIITAFPPANARIHYNAAGGAKTTKERTRLTYLRGFYGHEQDETGRAKPSALRSKPGSLTAILLQFHEEISGRWVTLLVLGTFTASQEEQWLYGVIEDRVDLSVVQGKEDWETRAKRLRKAGWGLTADPGPYRDRLRTLLRIPSDKAITTFVRTVGLKDIGDVNAFIRGNMLDDVSVHQRYTELTKHYDKQLEIDAEIETTRRMIEALRPLGDAVPLLQRLQSELDREPAAKAATAWRIGEERAAVLQRLVEDAGKRLIHVQGTAKLAKETAEAQQILINAIQASDAAKRSAALQSRAEALRGRRDEIDRRLAELRAALELTGGTVPGDATAFDALRLRLETIVREADADAEQRQDTLRDRKLAVEALQKQHDALRHQIDVAARSGSHLPPDDLQRRDQIAHAVGLRASELPYLGELIDVEPSQHEWRIALEKLLRVQARRMLVPSEHFPKVAAYVNATEFGARVRMERVLLKQPRLTMSAPEPDRVSSKLRVRTGSPFTDWVQYTLRTRFDHACFTSVQDYERHSGAAITREGLVRDRGDYHEKRDDIRIRDSRDHFLGWNNEEKLRAFHSELRELEARQREASVAIRDQRSANEQLKQQRDYAQAVLKALPTFDLIDLPRIKRELADLEKDRVELARTDPEAAQIERRLFDAHRILTQANTDIENAQKEAGGIEKEIKDLTADLHEIDESHHDLTSPSVEDVTLVDQFFTDPAPDQVKALTRWADLVIQRRDSHFKALEKKRGATREAIMGVMSSYLTSFAAESKSLSAAPDAAQSFLDRLQFLQDERLGELQDRFRKYLEENLALHASQLKSELDGQVSDAEERITEINRILAHIPWEGTAVIRILPRPNLQSEIRQFRDLLSRAGAPLFQPTEEQNRSAFAAVKELITYLADERVRKLVLDARQWRLFAVELRDPTIADPLQQRKFYLENTDGLSGGQKNKLSVTLLASALAFQYDVAGTRAVPGTFRTVIIDEAFARLDSENARYALELFKRFDFQLVLVHPLDGTVRVAEDYVQSFLLATIRDGRYTSLTGVRIEQFRDLVARAEADRALEGGRDSEAAADTDPAP